MREREMEGEKHSLRNWASKSESCSVMSDSLQPHGQKPTRFLCHGYSPSKNTEWLPYSPPGNLPNPGIKPRSPSLQTQGKPKHYIHNHKM